MWVFFPSKGHLISWIDELLLFLQEHQFKMQFIFFTFILLDFSFPVYFFELSSHPFILKADRKYVVVNSIGRPKATEIPLHVGQPMDYVHQ